MANDTESARQQANVDFNLGRSPTNTTNWDWQSRNTYDAEYQRRQQEQYERSRQS